MIWHGGMVYFVTPAEPTAYRGTIGASDRLMWSGHYSCAYPEVVTLASNHDSSSWLQCRRNRPNKKQVISLYGSGSRTIPHFYDSSVLLWMWVNPCVTAAGLVLFFPPTNLCMYVVMNDHLVVLGGWDDAGDDCSTICSSYLYVPECHQYLELPRYNKPSSTTRLPCFAHINKLYIYSSRSYLQVIVIDAL